MNPKLKALMEIKPNQVKMIRVHRKFDSMLTKIFPGMPRPKSTKRIADKLEELLNE